MQFIYLSKLKFAYGSSPRRAVISKVSNRANLISHLGFDSQIFCKGSGSLKCEALAIFRNFNTNKNLAHLSSHICRFQGNSMSASGSKAVSGDVYVNSFIMDHGSVDLLKPSVVFFGDKRVRSFRKALTCWRSNGRVDVSPRTWDSMPFFYPSLKSLHSPSYASHPKGNVANAPFRISARSEQLDNSADLMNCKVVHQKNLKLRSGSYYLPHPDKVEKGGEDAHFICEEAGVIGVADGVGGWADVGVDAGEYARQLMAHSASAVKEDPKGLVDPAKVLEKAHAETKVQGSSTACIVALTDQGIHAINLGDSGFIIIRDGRIVFRSPVQQYAFNFPYQLASGTEGDQPSSCQVLTQSVFPGDVIVAGTDGLFDNLYEREITTLVIQAERTGLNPQLTACNIATLAQQRAKDGDRHTPFSEAAIDAGFRYFGGKLDDITVVVSYVTNLIE